ncbi:MAG: Gfo/Idh/MocA family protein [Acidimicrobiales bacterium]
MKPIRVAVVGLGRMGRRHLRVLSEMTGVEVVCTVDPLAPERSAGLPHFPSPQRALASLGLDAAVVATPTSTHGEVAGILLEAGVPTLVEKPLAATVVEAEDLAGVANRTGTALVVGHVERFNPAVQGVQELLAAGTLGTPLAFTFRRVGLPPSSPPDADVLADLAVHDLDVCALLSGQTPTLVGAVAWPDSGPAESAQLLLLAGGASVALQVNWRTPIRIREFSLTTDRCLVEVNYTTQDIRVTEPMDTREVEGFNAFQSHYGAARSISLEISGGEPLAAQASAFLALLRGQSSPLLAGADAGLDAVRLAAMASAMAGTACKVRP